MIAIYNSCYYIEFGHHSLLVTAMYYEVARIAVLLRVNVKLLTENEVGYIIKYADPHKYQFLEI